MDASVVLEEEPVFIKIEPVCCVDYSAIPEMIPDSDNMKIEETMTENAPNISSERSLPVIKEENGSYHSTIEITPDIKTFVEDGSKGTQEETQKSRSGNKSSLSEGATTCERIEDPAADTQQNEEQGLHSPWIHNFAYNSLQSSSSACQEVNSGCDGLQAYRPFHIKSRYSCDLCRFSCEDNYILQTHMKLHNIPKPYFCNDCSRSYSSKNGLKEHRLACGKVPKPCCRAELGISCTHKTFDNLPAHTVKSSFPISCTVCGKYFQDKWALKQHMTYHSDERPYACNKCGQGFRMQKDLTIHLSVHSDIKNYICRICGRAFGRNWALVQHKRTHSNERNFICDQCGKTFKCRRDIINHLVVHSDARPLVCSVCGFAAKRHIELSLHKTIHSNNEPYSCLLCGKTFKHLKLLGDHKKSHHKVSSVPVRSHLCGICGKTFITRHYAITHMRLHGPEKPYSCNICKKTFKRRVYLKGHIEAVHKFIYRAKRRH